MSKRPESSRSQKPGESPKSKVTSQFPQASKKPGHSSGLDTIDEAGPAHSIAPPAPASRIPSQLNPIKGTMMPVTPGTTLNRDRSMAPGTTLNRDKLTAPGTTLNRDMSMTPGTTLSRDLIGPGTTLNRDISRLPKAQSIFLIAVASKRPASAAPRNVPSILTLPKDKTMALKQLEIEDMDGKERKDQDAWAQEQLEKNPSCPDNFKWERRTGGYQCKAGAHGITDALLAEGRNGLIALRGKNWDDLEGWEGPYYPDPKRPGIFIRGELPHQ